MTKILTICFCCLVNFIYSQNKITSYNFTQKKIEPCRTSINDSISVYKVHENFRNLEIDVIIKTENVITDECVNKKIDDEIKNALLVNQNPIFKINKKEIKNLYFSGLQNLVPNKISIIDKKLFKVLIFECFNFSYSTVGKGYINFCFKIDAKGNIIDKKMIESKLPLESRKYRKIF